MKQRKGSIDTTSAGRYRVRVRTPSGDRRTLGTFDTLDEAERMRDAAVEALDDHDDWGITLGEYGERWLTRRELSKAVRDPASDWSRWNTHIASAPIARVPLRNVTRRDVREWLDGVREGVAAQTARNVLTVMRGLLRSARDDGHTKLDPSDGLRVPREARTDDPWTWLRIDEQRRLVDAFGDVDGPLVAFAIGTGLRAGELCALRLADVHVDGGAPHVVVRYGKPPRLPTKAGRVRRVPLFGLALDATRTHLATLDGPNDHGVMFPRLRGGFRSPAHVVPWERWKACKLAAGIDRPLRWHDLRHTCASSLVSGEWGRAWSLAEVRDMLGHASVTTTERYAHLAGTAVERAARDAGHEWATVSAAFGVVESANQGEPPSGLEPETYGLRNRRRAVAVPGGCVARGPDAAREILVAAARGDRDALDDARRAFVAWVESGDAATIEAAAAVLAAATGTAKNPAKRADRK